MNFDFVPRVKGFARKATGAFKQVSRDYVTLISLNCPQPDHNLI